MSFYKNCISGVTHEGTPKGKWEKIGGVDCYIGTHIVDYPKDKAILFLPDAFGLQLINSQLLIDGFAANGFKTIGIDCLGGDPVPLAEMEAGTFDFIAWLARHSFENSQSYLEKVVNVLKEQGITTFYATGYCYGSRLVFNLAFQDVLKATVVTHPPHIGIEAPKDFEKYMAKSHAPLLVNSCESDTSFPAEAQAKADEVLGEGKFKPGYKREYFPGCKYGFAVRGDISDTLVKAGKEGAFKATIEWFLKHQ